MELAKGGELFHKLTKKGKVSYKMDLFRVQMEEEEAKKLFVQLVSVL